MKTTLNLNDSLLTQAKALRLPVFRGKGGLAPGIGGLSNRDMLDAADRDA